MLTADQLLGDFADTGFKSISDRTQTLYQDRYNSYLATIPKIPAEPVSL